MTFLWLLVVAIAITLISAVWQGIKQCGNIRKFIDVDNTLQREKEIFFRIVGPENIYGNVSTLHRHDSIRHEPNRWRVEYDVVVLLL